MHEFDKCELEESSSGPYQCTLTKKDVFALKDLITKIILDDSVILETGHDSVALNIGHISPAQKFVLLADKFLESPLLLDPYLRHLCDSFIPHLVLAISSAEQFRSNNFLFKYFFVLYHLSRIIGCKALVKHLPCDVSFFHNLLPFYLHSIQKNNSSDSWIIQYSCVILLVNLVQIPFPLSSILQGVMIESFIQTLLQICLSNRKDQLLASLLLAKLTCRIDARSLSEDPIIHRISNLKLNSVFQFQGVLFYTYYVYKFFHSENFEFSNLVVRLASQLCSFEGSSGSNLVRKYFLKIQLKRNFILMNHDQQLHLIQLLLKSLSDKDTENRWFGAKSLAKLYALFLDKSQEEFLSICFESCLNNLSVTFEKLEKDCYISESDLYLIHSSCLFFAELIRRNLISADIFEQYILPLLNKILVFDKLIGLVPKGDNIRDAGCYMSWCIARNPAFFSDSTSVDDDTSLVDLTTSMGKFQEFSVQLLYVAVSDRFIGVRRAAAAAFQELVGRKKSRFAIPDGLALLHHINFYSVSSIKSCFLEIIPTIITQYPGNYGGGFCRLLVLTSCSFWDETIREYALKATALLLQRNSIIFEPLFNVVADQLTCCNCISTSILHGYFVFAAEYLFIVKNIFIAQKLNLFFKTLVIDPFITSLKAAGGQNDNNLLLSLLTWVPRMLQLGITCDFPEDLILLCQLFLKNSYCTSNKSALISQDYSSPLKTCSNTLKDIQITFSESIVKSLFQNNSWFSDEQKEQLFSYWKGIIGDAEIVSGELKRGPIIGLFPFEGRQQHSVFEVITFFIEMMKKYPKPSQYYLREAFIYKICQLLCDPDYPLLPNCDPLHINNPIVHLQALMRGLDDYSTNFMGDVGSIIRKATLLGLVRLAQDRPRLWTRRPDKKIFLARLLRISCERIDSLRSLALTSLEKLVKTGFFEDCFLKMNGLTLENRDDLVALFFSDVQHKDSPEIQCQILRGLVFSIGGLSESHSHQSLNLLQKIAGLNGWPCLLEGMFHNWSNWMKIRDNSLMAEQLLACHIKTMTLLFQESAICSSSLLVEETVLLEQFTDWIGSNVNFRIFEWMLDFIVAFIPHCQKKETVQGLVAALDGILERPTIVGVPRYRLLLFEKLYPLLLLLDDIDEETTEILIQSTTDSKEIDVLQILKRNFHPSFHRITMNQIKN